MSEKRSKRDCGAPGPLPESCHLSPKLKSDLFQVVQFIMLCYGPGWFRIKTKPNLIHSPDHVLTSVTNYRKLPESTQKIVKPYIASNAYHANPEHILLSMLCSDDPQLREAALQQGHNLAANSGSLYPPRRSILMPLTSQSSLIGNRKLSQSPPHLGKVSKTPVTEIVREGGGGYPPFPLTFFR